MAKVRQGRIQDAHDIARIEVDTWRETYAGMVPAAAGGWDVPADSLAYLHKQEMVLPASLAEGVRGLVAGGGRDARPTGGDVHFHVSAMDGNSVKSFFKNNRNHVA